MASRALSVGRRLPPDEGEELELLENTLRYLEKLSWPGSLQIYVLDDSTRPALRAMAASYGFQYFARPGNEFAKSGNLRFATDRTSGEFIAIFDADFVPRSDFLLQLMPYFDAHDVGILQSPQYFDTSKQMNWVQRSGRDPGVLLPDRPALP